MLGGGGGKFSEKIVGKIIIKKLYISFFVRFCPTRGIIYLLRGISYGRDVQRIRVNECFCVESATLRSKVIFFLRNTYVRNIVSQFYLLSLPSLWKSIQNNIYVYVLKKYKYLLQYFNFKQRWIQQRLMSRVRWFFSLPLMENN